MPPSSVRIRKRFSFEAAHVLPHHPGKCSRLHGHSYRLDVEVAGPLQTSGPATGMVEDFQTLSDIVKREIVGRVDHSSLNDFMENPTAECIVAWIWEQLAPHVSGLTELVLWETRTACAVLRATDVAAR